MTSSHFNLVFDKFSDFSQQQSMMLNNFSLKRGEKDGFPFPAAHVSCPVVSGMIPSLELSSCSSLPSQLHVSHWVRGSTLGWLGQRDWSLVKAPGLSSVNTSWGRISKQPWQSRAFSFRSWVGPFSRLLQSLRGLEKSQQLGTSSKKHRVKVIPLPGLKVIPAVGMVPSLPPGGRQPRSNVESVPLCWGLDSLFSSLGWMPSSAPILGHSDSIPNFWGWWYWTLHSVAWVVRSTARELGGWKARAWFLRLWVTDFFLLLV